MASRIMIDSFSSLDDIPKRDRSNEAVLLSFFVKSGTRRVSTFEMTQPIMNAMERLAKDGKLKWVKSDYPWHAFELPDPTTDKP